MKMTLWRLFVHHMTDQLQLWMHHYLHRYTPMRRFFDLNRSSRWRGWDRVTTVDALSYVARPLCCTPLSISLLQSQTTTAGEIRRPSRRRSAYMQTCRQTVLTRRHMFHYFKQMLRVFDLMKHANFSGHFAKSACIEELRRSVVTKVES